MAGPDFLTFSPSPPYYMYQACVQHNRCWRYPELESPTKQHYFCLLLWFVCVYVCVYMYTCKSDSMCGGIYIELIASQPPCSLYVCCFPPLQDDSSPGHYTTMVYIPLYATMMYTAIYHYDIYHYGLYTIMIHVCGHIYSTMVCIPLWSVYHYGLYTTMVCIAPCVCVATYIPLWLYIALWYVCMYLCVLSLPEAVLWHNAAACQALSHDYSQHLTRLTYLWPLNKITDWRFHLHGIHARSVAPGL